MEKEELIKQIKKYCRPSNKVHRLSSYGLKAFFEGLEGFGIIDYISNDLFKEAMLEAGFKPTPRTEKEICCKYKILLVGSNIPKEFAGDGYWFKKRAKNGRV